MVYSKSAYVNYTISSHNIQLQKQIRLRQDLNIKHLIYFLSLRLFLG